MSRKALAAKLLDDALLKCSERLDNLDSDDPSQAKEFAKLATAVKALHSEHRATQNARMRNLERMSVSAVLARIRTMEKAEKEHIARELERMLKGNRLFG